MNHKNKLKIVFAESILSAAGVGICIPIMVVFFNSIGMNQALIGISQMMFTIAILFADIPMGYIADRYSRKKLNIIGDFGVALAFGIYAFAPGFWVVVLCEVLVGAFFGMTNGVDDSFVKFYSDKIDESGKLFKKNVARLKACHFIALPIAILIGMFVSKFDLRLCIAAVAVPYLIGGILAFFIDDIGDKIQSRDKNHIKDMIKSVSSVLKPKKVKWLVAAYAASREITHPVIWVFTPLLLLVGVPVYLVGIGWIFNYIFSIFGTFLAGKMAEAKPSVKLAMPILIAALGMLPIIINVNIVTVWMFALVGFAQGFSAVAISPIIQREIEDKYQTTAISIATTSARLFYIPVVAITNWAGDIKPEYTLLATLIIFLPLALVIYEELRSFEKVV